MKLGGVFSPAKKALEISERILEQMSGTSFQFSRHFLKTSFSRRAKLTMQFAERLHEASNLPAMMRTAHKHKTDVR